MAAQAEGGAIKLLRGPWNRAFLDELEMFPFGTHDDMADAFALAAGVLSRQVPPSTSRPFAGNGMGNIMPGALGGSSGFRLS